MVREAKEVIFPERALLSVFFVFKGRLARGRLGAEYFEVTQTGTAWASTL